MLGWYETIVGYTFRYSPPLAFDGCLVRARPWSGESFGIPFVSKGSLNGSTHAQPNWSSFGVPSRQFQAVNVHRCALVDLSYRCPCTSPDSLEARLVESRPSSSSSHVKCQVTVHVTCLHSSPFSILHFFIFWITLFLYTTYFLYTTSPWAAAAETNVPSLRAR